MVTAVISHPQPAPWAVYIVGMAITKGSNHRYNLSPMSTHFQLAPSQLPCSLQGRMRLLNKTNVLLRFLVTCLSKSVMKHSRLNKIYRFVATVYQRSYHNSGRYPSSCLLFKTQLNSRFVRNSQGTRYFSATSPTG
jgi:hypothetical protein